MARDGAAVLLRLVFMVARWFLAIALFLTLAACKGDPPIDYLRLNETLPDDAHLGGSAVLLTFWASWCAPCVAETPSLERLAKDSPGGLVVRVVPVETAEVDVRSFFPESAAAVALPVAERQGLIDALAPGALPVAFLVVNQRAVARFNGKRDWQRPELRRLLARLVAEHGSN